VKWAQNQSLGEKLAPTSKRLRSTVVAYKCLSRTFHMTQCLLYPFVHICGLSDVFQHVMMIINLMQFMDFISSSRFWLQMLAKDQEQKIKRFLEMSLNWKVNFKLF